MNKEPTHSAFENKTRVQLIRDLYESRNQLAALSQELDRLKTRQPDGAGRVQAGHENLRQQLLHETERKGAKGQTRGNRQRLRRLIDQAPVALAMFDREMRYLSASKGWLQDYQLLDRDLRGMSHYDIFPEIPEYWKEIHRRSLAGEVVRAERDRFERADGSAQYLRWEVRPWHDVSGDIGGIVIFSEDITQRERAEESLRESERRFRTMFMNAPMPYQSLDAEGNFLDVNQALLDLLGYSREDLIGRNFAHILYPDAAGLFQENFPKLKAIGEILGAEFEMVKKNGSTILVSLNGKIQSDIHGRFLRTHCIFQDITERKRADQQIRENEERLRLALEGADQGTWEYDFASGRINISQHTAELFGAETSVQLTHRDDWRRFVLKEDHARIERIIKTSIPAGRRYQFEYRIKREKDGLIRWIMTEGQVMIDEAGRPTRMIGIVRDITKQKQAEETLLWLNERLDQQVGERTALADARSKQLQALAVELIEAEEKERQRIAGLLHEDFQQLLAAARFMLQTSSHSASDLNKIQSLLEEAIRKSRNLSHELSPAVLHHSGLMAALEWLSMQMDEQFGLQVDLDIEYAKRVEASPLKLFLFRAVQELLFNVVKHADILSARVMFSGSENEIEVTVSDQGKGFVTDLLEASTKGVGLGLLSLRERASYIGGNLRIESAPGQGSRCSITIPLKLSTPDALKAQTETDHSPLRATSLPSAILGAESARILLVDDHKVMRQGLLELISRQPDIQVVGEAANGREALELARRLKPDVIVMDVIMPEMDGIEATRQIKAEMRDVRVIALSMFEDAHVTKAMRKAGAEAFISKTASMSELIKAIYGITQGRVKA